MRLPSIRVAGALSLLPLVLSGCDLLLAGLYPTDPFVDPFLEPGPSAEFDGGTATLQVTADGAEDQTLVLDEVVGSTEYDVTTVTWRNDEGWSMTITWFGVLPDSVRPDVTFQRIQDNELWITDYDQSLACAIDVGESNVDRVSGSGNCRQMRWRDGVGSATGFNPYIDDEPRFDVEITFEAEPAGDTQIS